MDSILNQTYKNIEVICVNDGSPDRCLDILREYALKDGRVRLIEQDNLGVAAACNNGTDMARGKYITYVGSDEWIEHDEIETITETIEKYDCDVVMFSYYREYENHTLRKHIFEEPMIVFGERECRKIHRRQSGIIGRELSEPENADALCSTVTKLYRLAFYPGPGLGGHCIPLDPYYLSWKAREYGFHTNMIESSMIVNDRMPEYCGERAGLILYRFKKALKGSNILVLGVAYKQDVDDCRESPAIRVIEYLENNGALVSYYDPWVKEYVDRGKTRSSLPVLTSEVLKAADLVIVTTAHTQLDYDFIQRNSNMIFNTENVEDRSNIELL